MMYLTSSIILIALLVLVHECYIQVKNEKVNFKRLFIKAAILFIAIQSTNYLNNKFLNTAPKPYIKEMQTKVYQEPLKDTSLKPMPKEERQERTDVLIDRKQITDKLYN